MAVAGVPRVTVMTDARAGAAHFVTDDAMNCLSRYVAVCGAQVLPASLTAPLGPSCPQCASWAVVCQRGLLSG